MSVDEGFAGATPGLPAAAILRVRERVDVATAAFWLLGGAVVVAAQPGLDRRLAALGTAAVGVGVILAVTLLTEDAGRRYFRSLVGTMIMVSIAATWLLRSFTGGTDGFQIAGENTRITVPLLFVLFAPLALRALPTEARPRALWRSARAPLELWRRASGMDRIFAGYATVVLVPALLVGLAHGNRLTFIAQDLGLIVFFVFMYVAGRAVAPETARSVAGEFVDLLLAFAVVSYLLLGWTTPPVYEYAIAACTGSFAFALLRPRTTRLLSFGVALAIFAAFLAATAYGLRSETTVELLGGLGILAYLAIRLKPLLPRWALFGAALAALVFFVGFTSDGATLRGSHYTGKDPSNIGRVFEAHQVRHDVLHSPVSVVFGRGLGGTIDETGGNPIFTHGLAAAGRDLAHVQEIHLLEYSFLLKEGFIGVLWLAAFAVGLAVLVVRTLDGAVRDRDPSLVVYAAVPLLSFAAAFAAATHLQDNPLNAFSIGILVTCLGGSGRAPAPAE